MIEKETLLFLLIFLTTLVLSSLRKKTPVDLIFLIGGAATLLLGLTPAREFMHTLSNPFLLCGVGFFVLLSTIGNHFRSFPCEIPLWKDLFRFLPAELWITMLGGILFSAALFQTSLPEHILTQLAALSLGDPYILLLYFITAAFLFSQVLPPLIALLLFLPLCAQALSGVGYQGNIEAASLTGLLTATLFPTELKQLTRRS